MTSRRVAPSSLVSPAVLDIILSIHKIAISQVGIFWDRKGKTPTRAHNGDCTCQRPTSLTHRPGGFQKSRVRGYSIRVVGYVSTPGKSPRDS